MSINRLRFRFNTLCVYVDTSPLCAVSSRQQRAMSINRLRFRFNTLCVYVDTSPLCAVSSRQQRDMSIEKSLQDDRTPAECYVHRLFSRGRIYDRVKNILQIIRNPKTLQKRKIFISECLLRMMDLLIFNVCSHIGYLRM